MFITEAGKMSLKGQYKSIKIWGGYLIKCEFFAFRAANILWLTIFLIWKWTGRVKNPDFVEQVAAICENEDHLIVVRNM